MPNPRGARRDQLVKGRRTPLREYALASGELGAAAAQTLVVVLLPILLRDSAPSATMIGFAVGGEGFFALFMPFWAGSLSDRLPAHLARRFGRRTFFLLLAAPIMALTLISLPFLSGYVWLALVAFAFFAALHVYLTPLWALLLDDVPDARRGRVQGVRGILRAAGLAYGLVAGGLLYALWRPLPFLVGAAMIIATTAATAVAAGRGDARQSTSQGVLPALRALTARRRAMWLLAGNALWNGAIDGVRPYVFLFAGAVLGIGVAVTSVALMLLIGGVALGSAVVGYLADRYDRSRLLAAGLAVLCIAMGGAFFARELTSALVVLLLAGLSSAVIIALPYPLFAAFAGEEHAGQYTGLFVASVALGRIAAPLIVGASIDLGARVLPKTGGYPFMWLTAALFAVASLLTLIPVLKTGRRTAGSDSVGGDEPVAS